MASYELRGSGPEGTLAFTGECTIEHAENMKQGFIEALGKFEELDLDMRAIERVDITFLQLVVATQVELEKNGKSLTATEGTPPIVAEAAEEAGMTLGSYEHCFWKKG